MKRIIFRVLPITEKKKLIGWKVAQTKPIGEERRYRHSDGCSKLFAIGEAVRLAKFYQPSQLFIHRADGTIQEERTYPRSSDSRRHRG